MILEVACPGRWRSTATSTRTPCRACRCETIGHGSWQPIRILGSRDHPVFREGMATIIGSSQTCSGCKARRMQWRPSKNSVGIVPHHLDRTFGSWTKGDGHTDASRGRSTMLDSLCNDFGTAMASISRGHDGLELQALHSQEHAEERSAGGGVVRVHAGGRYSNGRGSPTRRANLGEEDLTAREWRCSALFEDGRSQQTNCQSTRRSRRATVNFHIKNLVGTLGARTDRMRYLGPARLAANSDRSEHAIKHGQCLEISLVLARAIPRTRVKVSCEG